MSWTPSPCARTCSAISPSGVSGAGEHEPDVVLDHDVAGPVADLGLEAAEGDRREAPQRAVVGRRLAGVADPELDVVDALERQEVGGLGVGVRVDPGAGLVGGAREIVSVIADLPCWRRRGRPRPRRRRDRWSWPPMLRPACDTGAHGSDLLERLLRRPPPAWTSSAASVEARRAVAAGRGLRRGARGRLGTAARSSPTSPRCSRTGSARSSAILASRATGARPVRAGRDRRDAHRARRRDRPLPPRELFDRIDVGIPGGRVDAGRDLRRRTRLGRGVHPAGRDDRSPAIVERFVVEPPRGARRSSSRDPRDAPA